MDDLEIFRMMARCEDKEQMMQCVNEFNTRKAVTNGEYIRYMLTENHIADDRKKVRLVDANALEEFLADAYGYQAVDILGDIAKFPTVDAIPVEDIKLHHILINNEGVPEVKLQIGERYFILYTDPVDVREVVHGHWFLTETEYLNCSVCGKAYYTGIETWSAALDNLKYAGGYKYCPNCGAKMDGERRTYDT